MLKIRNLESGYGRLRVLKSISLHVNPGEIVTIIGANGAGKSTLLNTVSGTVRSQSGSILFKDAEISKSAPEHIVRVGCSLVPEGRQLFPTMTVSDNLILGAYTLYQQRKRSEAEKELENIYNLFPRLAEREKQLAGTLSGGEQQMVAIGRSLMAQPDFVMLDEPSMGLAPLIVRDILGAAVTLKEQGKTVLLVEQNARAALQIADRGYVMETGHLILEGSAEELLENRDVQRAYLGKDYKHIND
ncbi:MAG: ABC transporter ATP-binding protein [Spirochaetales bacterium]|jgi:branched-chain amino acid transport system ATP-binding protein|nr:ABC transporter ATP-binding protein [Spirochaetales bacterium]